MVKVDKQLKLSKLKQDYLTSCGFTQTYSGEPHETMLGKFLASMECWEKVEHYGLVKLYIHFSNDPSESNHCELYDGGEGYESDSFSERNLISEMKKRGFKPKH